MADKTLKTDGSEPSVAVKLNRAHWIGEERHDPPEVVSVPLSEALRLIETGLASRTDPLRAE